MTVKCVQHFVLLCLVMIWPTQHMHKPPKHKLNLILSYSSSTINFVAKNPPKTEAILDRTHWYMKATTSTQQTVEKSFAMFLFFAQMFNTITKINRLSNIIDSFMCIEKGKCCISLKISFNKLLPWNIQPDIS